MGASQLDLFPDSRPEAVAPADVGVEIRELGAALPAEIRLGTSSWSFPGWAGLVFDRPAARETLARYGLAAYAGHPVLRTVGIDRSYYAPLAPSAWRAYADAVPEDFRFLAKAHELCTLERFTGRERHGQPRGQRNSFFLDAGYATDAVVAPFCDGLGPKAGPLVFQFSPQRKSSALAPDEFAERLHAFLSRLPPGPLYAVEIRHTPWLTAAYADALCAAQAVHCLTVHPSMPPIPAQAAAARVAEGAALVVRWMLGGDQRYEAARERYAPFDRIVDADPASRGAIAKLCVAASRAGCAAFVTINNKAEGSGPLSAVALAREIVRAWG